MTAEQQQRAIVAATYQVDVLHELLASIERLIDGRIVASVYAARLGQILATLRKHKLTDRDEIEQIVELITLTSMDDGKAVGAHDFQGAPILTPEDKKQLN